MDYSVQKEISAWELEDVDLCTHARPGSHSLKIRCPDFLSRKRRTEIQEFDLACRKEPESLPTSFYSSL